ncbi:hypothetical protein M501DRAFT_932251 [Patellaria atrata CBS 101060]|uniref:HD/PDEase domain-containing protein n=1 Tax=Patellaria atrata CBS 101060 TaxID=1346257 RepID=A0A9P4SCV8_9PEZI|nr:hypothetical protein M501DRAFT_932251 [Patellaria atrata CBS 101060]
MDSLVGSDIVGSVEVYVKDFMSRFDASHDYNHIKRVLALSKSIMNSEREKKVNVIFDTDTVILAALLHDVGDKKYVEPDHDPENQIADLLRERGASEELALKVQMIATHVSFSTEMKNPELINTIISQYPELAIVQDADRLDAIGAVGIGRAFTFGGAKRSKDGMQQTIDHFTEKLEKLGSMMKTETGKRIALERTQRLILFRSWWIEETTLPL